MNRFIVKPNKSVKEIIDLSDKAKAKAASNNMNLRYINATLKSAQSRMHLTS